MGGLASPCGEKVDFPQGSFKVLFLKGDLSALTDGADGVSKLQFECSPIVNTSKLLQ